MHHRARLAAVALLATLVAALPTTATDVIPAPSRLTLAPGGTLAVAITQPTAGTTVRGSGWAVVRINGASGIANRITLTLGGRTVGSTTSASAGPISLPYDSTLSGDGVQMLTASVRDATGNTGAWSVSVNVANGAGAPMPPAPAPTPPASTPQPPAPAPSPTAALKIFITQPADGATVSGTVWPTLWVEGQSGTSNTFALSANDQVVASQVTSSRGPVTLPWVTTGIASGTVSLTATVRDAAGNTRATTISVTVRN